MEEVHLRKRVTPKNMEVLLLLVQAPMTVISAQTILDNAWRGRVVNPNAVSKAITSLRKLFEDSAQAPKLFQTLPKRGYKALVAPKRLDAQEWYEIQKLLGVQPDSFRIAAAEKAHRIRQILVCAGLVLVNSVVGYALYDAADRCASWWCQPPQHATVLLKPFVFQGSATRSKELENVLPEMLAKRLETRDHLTVQRGDAVGESILDRFIASANSAEYIIEGVLSESSTDLEVTVQLVREVDGERLYTKQVSSPLPVDEGGINHLLGRLEPTMDALLNNVHRRTMETIPTDNAEAFGLFRSWPDKGRNKEGLLAAIEHGKRIIRLEPRMTEAYVVITQSMEKLAVLVSPDEYESVVEDLRQVLQETLVPLDDSEMGRIAQMVFAKATIDLIQEEKLSRERILFGPPEESKERRHYSIYYSLYANLLWKSGLFELADTYHREGQRLCRSAGRCRGSNDFGDSFHTVLWRDGSQAAADWHEAFQPLKESTNTGLIADRLGWAAYLGQFDIAEYCIERLRELDAGLRVVHGELELALHRSLLRGDTEKFVERLRTSSTGHLSKGLLYLQLGLIDEALGHWRQMGLGERKLLVDILRDQEYKYPAFVRQDQRYQGFLDEVGIGRSWIVYLSARLQELEAFTEIPYQAPAIGGILDADGI